MRFCKEFLKKQFQKMIVQFGQSFLFNLNNHFLNQNLAVQRGQWLSFLCCYVVCEMEKTICPLPRLKCVLNSIKNVHAPMKLQHVISATRRWAYFAKDFL